MRIWDWLRAPPDARTVVFIPHRDGMLACCGVLIGLTPRESRFLDVLLLRQPEAVEFGKLIGDVYGENEPDSAHHALYKLMAGINVKLRKTPCRIEGVRGYGFKLTGRMLHERWWSVE